MDSVTRSKTPLINPTNLTISNWTVKSAEAKKKLDEIKQLNEKLIDKFYQNTCKQMEIKMKHFNKNLQRLLAFKSTKSNISKRHINNLTVKVNQLNKFNRLKYLINLNDSQIKPSIEAVSPVEKSNVSEIKQEIDFKSSLIPILTIQTEESKTGNGNIMLTWQIFSKLLKRDLNKSDDKDILDQIKEFEIFGFKTEENDESSKQTEQSVINLDEKIDSSSWVLVGEFDFKKIS